MNQIHLRPLDWTQPVCVLRWQSSHCHAVMWVSGDPRPGNVSKLCIQAIPQANRQLEAGRHACFASLSVNLDVNYQSPPAIGGVEWNLNDSDVLTATASQSRLNSDAAFYVIVEIPDTVPPGPENIFRDYGNVPRGYLRTYCSQHNASLEHPYFCNNTAGNNCSTSFRIEQCIALFPEASDLG